MDICGDFKVLLLHINIVCIGASQVVLVAKNPTCQCRRHKRRKFDPWIRKILWRAHKTSLRELFWILWKFIALQFLRVSYWPFINYIWWYQTYLLFHDPWFFLSVSVHLSKWSPFPDSSGLLWQRQFFSQLC